MKKLFVLSFCAVLNFGCGDASHCVDNGGYYNDISRSCVCPAYSAIGRCLTLGGRTPEVLFADGTKGELKIAGRANSHLTYHNKKLSIEKQDFDAGYLIRNQETQLVVIFPRITRVSNMTFTLGDCIAKFKEGDIDTVAKNVKIDLEARSIDVVAHCNGEFETSYNFDGHLGISNLKIRPRS